MNSAAMNAAFWRLDAGRWCVSPRTRAMQAPHLPISSMSTDSAVQLSKKSRNRDDPREGGDKRSTRKPQGTGTTPVTDKRATVHNSRPENAQRPALGGGAHTHVRSFSVFVLAQRRKFVWRPRLPGMTTPPPRDRPLGETSGSSQRPSRRLAAASLDFDLQTELTSLKQEASWERGDRNARTLVEEPDSA